MTAIRLILGLSQRPAMTRAWHSGRSSSPDAQLPAGLCADRFGDATTAVIGVQKIYPVTVGLASDLAKQPYFSLAWITQNMPFKYQADRDHYLEAFRRAGLDSGVRDCCQKRSS